MENVYLVWWNNGEPYREDLEWGVDGVFSTEEKAQSYVDNWTSEYRRKAEEFYKNRGEDFDEEDFKIDFPESVWIVKRNLQ